MYIRTVFNCDHRQFAAFFAILWKISIDDIVGISIGVEVRHWFGSEAQTRVSTGRIDKRNLVQWFDFA